MTKTVLLAHPSADVYGADLQLLESVSALVDSGWRAVVAVPADGPLVARLERCGAEVIFVNFPVLRRDNARPHAFAAMLAAALWCLPRLVRTIRACDPDVVYANTVTIPWWLLAARVSARRVIAHLHEAEAGDRRMVLKALLTPLLLADAVIVISVSTLDAMVAVVPRLAGRANLIYNGVPEPPTPPEPARRSVPLRIVTVGRLSPRKAPHLVLEAVARLRQDGYALTVDVVGTAFTGYEWYEAELRERASRPDLDGAVQFTGYVSPIWPSLASADIAVAPSLREPFGNAVVEAQLARRPVVATAALGHTESIVDGRSGLLVPPEDVEAMAAAIARLVDDPELAERLAVEARSRARDLFAVPRYRAEVTALVERLAGANRSLK